MLCFAFKSVNHSILFARKVSYAKKPIISVILSIDRSAVREHQCAASPAVLSSVSVERHNRCRDGQHQQIPGGNTP